MRKMIDIRPEIFEQNILKILVIISGRIYEKYFLYQTNKRSMKNLVGNQVWFFHCPMDRYVTDLPAIQSPKG